MANPLYFHYEGEEVNHQNLKLGVKIISRMVFNINF